MHENPGHHDTTKPDDLRRESEDVHLVRIPVSDIVVSPAQGAANGTHIDSRLVGARSGVPTKIGQRAAKNPRSLFFDLRLFHRWGDE